MHTFASLNIQYIRQSCLRMEPICQSHRSLEKITSIIAIKVIQKLIRPKKKKKIRDFATQHEKSQKWLITKLAKPI